jgi:conjugal transfer pilus assembly protein TraA
LNLPGDDVGGFKEGNNAMKHFTKGKGMALAQGAAVVALAATLGSTAAYAGADTTFNTALTAFTGFLEGSGGKIITVLSLAGGIVGLASGRFSLAQVAIPVGVGVGAGTGVPIVTAAVTATI